MSTPEQYNANQMDLGRFTDAQIVHLVKAWQKKNNLEIDGYCGPQTQTALLQEMFGEDVTPSKLGLKALEVAILEIGNGELGGNNSGNHVARYHGVIKDRGSDDIGAWCASFVGYCCSVAADSIGVDLPFQKSGGAKTTYKRAGEAGQFVGVNQALPGDFVCWDRGKLLSNGMPSWLGHIGFVEKLENGILHTVEGNVGRFPSTVRRFMHDIDKEPKLIGCARLP
jgi:hypothetical protein